MAPKKKTNKKGDDWEADLGEAPVATPVESTEAAPAEAEADPEDEFPAAGGLMAMMRKKQKKKKGKQAEDTVEGEEPPAEEDAPVDLAEKQAVEASIEDEFALPDKKGKGKAPAAKPAKEEEDDEERGADGKVMTKAQKEKAKKEREKQRKKENVSHYICIFKFLRALC